MLTITSFAQHHVAAQIIQGLLMTRAEAMP